MGEVGGVDDVLGRVGVDAQPVAEAVELPGRQQLGRAPLAAELDELDHRGILPLQQPAVAVDLVDRPGADDAGVGPGRAAVVAGHLHRRDHRELAVGALAVGQVDQPLGEERLDVADQGRRADVDLRIAGPAQSLVALGAVGRDVDEVGPLRPVDVAEELVEHRVGAGERAHDRRVARQRDPRDRLLGRPRLQPGDLDVLEAVEREPRLPGLLALTVADIGIRDAGLAEVGRVDRAVRVEPLGEPQGDLPARFAVDLEPDDAGEVLAQVEHERPGLRLGDRLRLRARRRRAPAGRDATGRPDSARRRDRPGPSRLSSKPGASQPVIALRAS